MTSRERFRRIFRHEKVNCMPYVTYLVYFYYIHNSTEKENEL